MKESNVEEVEYVHPVEEDAFVSRKKIYLALSGSMVALGAAGVGYQMFGMITGIGFVLMVFGILWFMQTQLATALDTIEIKIEKELD
jgi:hypothetical protein